MKGALIVIDGGDGSGKATQARMLLDYCKKHIVPFAYLDFPQYDKFFGKLVGTYLRGELGELKAVSPYLAALPFALDRFSQRKAIQREIDAGKLVIANRYVTSNIAYQAARFDKPEEAKDQEHLIAWIEELEYRFLQLPKENLVVYLHVDPTIAKQLTLKKNGRSYLNGKKEDIHEKSHTYRDSVNKLYEKLYKRYDHWEKIECTKNGTIRSKEEILEEIIAILKEKKYISI
ncbi:thymidylate kinase [Candidatus Woesebacteria bacterium]|nr:thymidylate kinase [Candidatus Woesebacteria bacterium]